MKYAYQIWAKGSGSEASVSSDTVCATSELAQEHMEEFRQECIRRGLLREPVVVWGVLVHESEGAKP